MQGIIKKVTRDRAYGFIRAEDGVDYFFHESELKGATFDAMREGVAVTFEPQAADKGPRAVEIRLAG